MTQTLPDLLRLLAGCWDLVEAAFTRPDGTTFEPWGPEPAGTFIVTLRGDFSAHVMRRSRERFASELQPAPDEKQRAYDEYLGYFGEVEKLDAQTGTLTLRVGGAINPNWVGGEQVRHVEVIDDDHIVLRTPPISIGGTELVGKLAWARRR